MDPEIEEAQRRGRRASLRWHTGGLALAMIALRTPRIPGVGLEIRCAYLHAAKPEETGIDERFDNVAEEAVRSGKPDAPHGADRTSG